MVDKRCSVAQYLEVVSGTARDYEQLGRFHYRGGLSGPCAGIYALKEFHPVRRRFGDCVGVIVYTMGAPALELRNAATGGRFSGFGDRRLGLEMVNKHIRCISRVIIEPRYRGLGLASRLVRETMPKMNVGIVEAMAVMGGVNPFFEKAGMRRYEGGQPLRCVKMAEAFGMVRMVVLSRRMKINERS